MNNQERPSRIGDVRLTLFAMVYFSTWSDGSLRTVFQFLESQSPGHISVFGVAQGVVTSTTRKHVQVALALHHLVPDKRLKAISNDRPDDEEMFLRRHQTPKRLSGARE